MLIAAHTQTMPFGSTTGSTMVTSHVNYSDGGKAPFYPAGNPDVTATPKLDWLFTRTGDPTLNLVTCAGSGFVREDGEGYLEYNLISSADLVGEIEA